MKHCVLYRNKHGCNIVSFWYHSDVILASWRFKSPPARPGSALIVFRESSPLVTSELKRANNAARVSMPCPHARLTLCIGRPRTQLYISIHLIIILAINACVCILFRKHNKYSWHPINPCPNYVFRPKMHHHSMPIITSILCVSVFLAAMVFAPSTRSSYLCHNSEGIFFVLTWCS